MCALDIHKRSKVKGNTALEGVNERKRGEKKRERESKRMVERFM